MSATEGPASLEERGPPAICGDSWKRGSARPPSGSLIDGRLRPAIWRVDGQGTQALRCMRARGYRREREAYEDRLSAGVPAGLD
jgi:hypothetical protein